MKYTMDGTHLASQVFTRIEKINRISANIHSNHPKMGNFHNFQKFLEIPPNFSRFCKFLQNSPNFLHSFSSFLQISSNSSKFLKIFIKFFQFLNNFFKQGLWAGMLVTTQPYCRFHYHDQHNPEIRNAQADYYTSTKSRWIKRFQRCHNRCIAEG